MVEAKYVPGYGPSTAKLIIVGEAPGETEEELGIPFAGTSGRDIAAMLRAAGISIDECYRTNVFKYRPPGNKIKLAAETGHTVEEGIPQLWSEIRAIIDAGGGHAILAIGDTALSTLTKEKGIKKWRGSILPTRLGISKVIPTIHPAALYHHDGKGAMPWRTRAYIAHDIARAVKESGFKGLNLPVRLLQVCRGSRQLYEFIQLYRHKQGLRRISVDIESNKCIPSCVGLAFNRSHALSVPLFNFARSPNQIPESELVEIWMMLADLLEDPEIEIIGQNWKYDQDKLERPIGIKAYGLWLDTMLLAHEIYPEFPTNLAFLTSIFTREPYYKDEYREFDPERDSPDQVYLYNAKDAAVTYEIAEALIKEGEEFYGTHLPTLLDFLRQLHSIYFQLDRVGFAVNDTLKQDASKEFAEKILLIDREIEELAGHPVNVRSSKDIPALCAELNLPERAGYDEDSLTQLLGNHAKDERTTRLLTNVIHNRRNKRTYGLLQSNLDYDRRARTSSRIFAADTGRSGTGILKPPIRPDRIGYNFQNLTKHGEIGHFFRKQFVADSGEVIFNADLSQAEPRIVAHLSKDDYVLQLFATGKDVHRITAGWIFDLTEAEALALPKESPADPRRFIGKTTRNAAAYGEGKKRFMITTITDAKKSGIDIQLSEREAGEILDKFHARSPNIRGVYHKEIWDILNSQRPPMLEAPYGHKRRFFDRVDESMLRAALAHIPQRTVRHHMAWAMIGIKKEYPDLRIVVEAHDAITCLIRHDEIADVYKLVKKYMEKPIDFSTCSLPRGELLIPAEVEVGDNYKDLIKYVA